MQRVGTEDVQQVGKPVCQLCNGTKQVEITSHRKDGIVIEKAPCPQCGGTGIKGLRHK